MKHEGRATYRMRENPLERKYHDAWILENERGDLLAWLLGDGERKGVVGDRDAMVAATVVQWLGSPVGQHFVAGVLGHNDMVSGGGTPSAGMQSWTATTYGANR